MDVLLFIYILKRRYYVYQLINVIINLGCGNVNIYTCFLLFIIYSFVGWIIEVITEYYHHKRFVNRGFLIGPYCSIYGAASVIMILLLNKYINDPIVLFVMAVVICSIIEYFASYVMEKLFNARWWDYSNNKFNINGRICLETMIPFGFGGLLLMYFINPFVVKVLSYVPENSLKIVTIILFLLFLMDCIISFKIILGFKKVTFKQEKDNTAEITNKVKDVLIKKSKFSKRLINSFPNLRVRKRKPKKRNK